MTCNLACVASVSVEFSALKSRFSYFWTRAKWDENEKREGGGEERGRKVTFAYSPLPLPSSLFLLSPHFARVQNYENRGVFSEERHGNACHAGYLQPECFEGNFSKFFFLYFSCNHLSKHALIILRACKTYSISDHRQISPCNTNAYLTPEVMRIKDTITQGEFSQYFNDFSPVLL